MFLFASRIKNVWLIYPYTCVLSTFPSPVKQRSQLYLGGIWTFYISSASSDHCDCLVARGSSNPMSSRYRNIKYPVIFGPLLFWGPQFEWNAYILYEFVILFTPGFHFLISAHQPWAFLLHFKPGNGPPHACYCPQPFEHQLIKWLVFLIFLVSLSGARQLAMAASLF